MFFKLTIKIFQRFYLFIYKNDDCSIFYIYEIYVIQVFLEKNTSILKNYVFCPNYDI